MPIIPTVGRKSLRLRFLITAIYTLLVLGSITTCYPFLLMLGGSLSSNNTAQENRLIPRYFYSERGLFEAFLWHKYYRSSVADLEHQWNVLVPVPLDQSRSTFTVIPGELPEPDEEFVAPFILTLCEARFEKFKDDYEAAESPKVWNSKLEKVAKKNYPFAVESIKKLVDSSKPFELQRHILISSVRKALGNRIEKFIEDYISAGEPNPESSDFDALIKNHLYLTTNPQFMSLIRDYYLHKKPDLEDPRTALRVKDFLEFRQTLPVSYRDSFWVTSSKTFKGNQRYRDWLKKRYGNLANLVEAHNTSSSRNYESWVRVPCPNNNIKNRDYYPGDGPVMRDWYLWLEQIPSEFIRAPGIEHEWSLFLRRRYKRDISTMNEAYGTTYMTFRDIPLLQRVPGKDTVQREDWEVFVRKNLSLIFMRFDGGTEMWGAFLKEKFSTLDKLNQELKHSYQNWDEIKLPSSSDEPVKLQKDQVLRNLGYPPTKLENNLLLEFVEEKVPAENIRILTGENLYRNWLMDKYGTTSAINDAYGTNEKSIYGFYYPTSTTDWMEFYKSKGETFWFTFTRSYTTAIDHLLRWRRSLVNTAIYCSAVVLLALLVNPLCAYALSRFNLPGSYQILLFLMATMAFPAEVTMIPNFLSLKSFPLLRIITAIVGLFIGAGICTVYIRREKIIYPILGAIIGGALGATVLAEAFSSVSGLAKNVPLLNTFWALILPGVASGFSIFILKGFFDSLPQELYDSAVVDGASEMRIFAQITMPMSKPVLAVIALWSFTAAYGSFTWALIICQDPKMWTLMVHLYQYQLYADPSEIMAALTLACIPTLFVFIIVQKVILKGIVFPTFK